MSDQFPLLTLFSSLVLVIIFLSVKCHIVTSLILIEYKQNLVIHYYEPLLLFMIEIIM